MKKGLIITGGRLDMAFAGEFCRKFLNRREFLKDMPAEGSEGISGEQAVRVISVDGGLEKTKALGLVPDAIVGDFDTVSPDILEECRRHPGILWDVHKPEKDETDTELAINTAIKLGCTRIAVLGATGGRVDHELSNIHLLKLCLDCQVEACLYDSQNKIYLLKEGKTFKKGETYGKYISFIPLTEQVRGITLTGFKYPLNDKTISIGVEAGLCVSNELVGETGTITFDSGILVCVESRD